LLSDRRWCLFAAERQDAVVADGEFARNTARLLARLPDLVWGLPMAPFEGMGTLFQFNPLLTPSLWPLGVFDETVGVSVGYVICAG
jgi:hypothetical protein